MLDDFQGQVTSLFWGNNW